MDKSLQNSILDFVSHYKTPLLILLLTIIAATPRLYQLGELGFYMDEETTAFASRSMAETGSPHMPSGMPYYRSLPHTWLNSISANTFGLDNEYSYRLPGALLGTLTIPLVFLLARPFTGTAIAFLAALLLSVSEWHIITSRQARMYAPFLFFYVAASFSILAWAKKDSLKNLITAALMFFIAASLHNIGVFLALVPLIALFIKDYALTPQYKLILFSIIAGVITYLYGKYFVGGPFDAWRIANGIDIATDAAQSLRQKYPVSLLQIAQGILGAFLGIWLAKKSAFSDVVNGKEFRILARYSLAILLGGLALTGNAHGALLAYLLLLLLTPFSLKNYLRTTRLPLLIIAAFATITAGLIITEQGATSGIKSLLMFPYPNWITLHALSAGLTVTLLATTLYFACKNKTTSDADIRAILILSLFPLILVGIFMKWAAARYLIQAYPFILIITSYAVYSATQKLFRHWTLHANRFALIFGILIIITGVLDGHGLLPAYKVATVNYGDQLNEAALIFPFYPDHKTAGEFVASHRAQGDIIIAEDVLTQYWYAGKIDYWLRQYSTSGGKFLYRGNDGDLHDIYVNSKTATPQILQSIINDSHHRAWLITSGETFTERHYYLSKEQQAWLQNIEDTTLPAFTGKDKITKVYCLHCTSGD